MEEGNNDTGPKALVVNVNNNHIEISDSEAMVAGLRRGGFNAERIALNQLDKVADGMDFGVYDFIAVWPAFNSTFVSGGTKRITMERMVNEAKPGSFHLAVCDVRQAFSPYMWNKEENSRDHRVNPFMGTPITVMGSFAKTMYSDPEAMKRKDELWMRKVHPESKFLAMEWLMFHAENKVSELEKVLDNSEPYTKESVNRFYYGLEKAKVAHSLKDMGMGSDPEDAVFGKISKYFPDLRDLKRKPENRLDKTDGPDEWLPIAQSASKLLLPYDPIKGDHQVTLRFLEYAVTGAPVEVDPRVNREFLKYLDKDEWEAKSNSVSQELREYVEKRREESHSE